MNKEKEIVQYEHKDWSNVCSHDDDKDPHCWFCNQFVLPIGCMKGKE